MFIILLEGIIFVKMLIYMCVFNFNWMFIFLVIKETNDVKLLMFKEIYCVINRIGFEMWFVF